MASFFLLSALSRVYRWRSVWFDNTLFLLTLSTCGGIPSHSGGCQPANREKIVTTLGYKHGLVLGALKPWKYNKTLSSTTIQRPEGILWLRIIHHCINVLASLCIVVRKEKARAPSLFLNLLSRRYSKIWLAVVILTNIEY